MQVYLLTAADPASPVMSALLSELLRMAQKAILAAAAVLASKELMCRMPMHK